MKQATKEMVRIRPFEKGDYPALKIIYQQGIDTGNATFQTSAKNWLGKMHGKWRDVVALERRSSSVGIS